MSFCESTWDYANDARVCRQCGMTVSGTELREKGQLKALESAARGCAMQSATAALHRQTQRRIGDLWGQSE